MNILLPEKVNNMIKIFQDNGFEAYAVGGCVRDSVLGRMPEDWDVTTSAMPWQTKQLFPRTFDTGIEHGTITVLLDKEAFEVTTYRIDGEYEDNRHPKEVQYTRKLSEDLLRRDFTMNAMAYNDKDGLVDIFGGLKDLKEGVIRCVGNPIERFSEDALRIMRAVRFAAQLGFEIEINTQKAAQELSHTLSNISAERIQVELVKLLVSSHPELILMMHGLNITKVILPEFYDLMNCGSLGLKTVQSVREIRPDKTLRLVMLLHDVDKPHVTSLNDTGEPSVSGYSIRSEELSKQILCRLKFDNETIRKVSKLIHYHDYKIPVDAKSVRFALNEISLELFDDYLEVRRALIMVLGGKQKMNHLSMLKETKECYLAILERGDCISLKNLAVTGNDLIESGITSGKIIGEILNCLLKIVLENPEYNTKPYLITYVGKHFS